MAGRERMEPGSTPMTAERWDPANPSGSFRNFASRIHAVAKEILLRDGHHSEMFFFMPLNGVGHVILWRNNDRDLEAGWLRRHIREQYVYGVVHVVEAWMRMATSPGDHVLKQIVAGEIRISELKPQDRQEALVVSAQSRDGWATSWVDQILRDKTGRISLGGCTEVDDFRGRFGRVFG